jgi:AcrR family transcriptional regulator
MRIRAPRAPRQARDQMAKRRSHDEEGMAAWAGPALIDGAELARRQTELIAGSSAGRAAAISLSFGRAAIVMAGELGYEGVRVEELIERAGSNRARFYDAFADKETCFTWAYDAAIEAICERLLDACESAPDWASGMRHALEELAGFVAAEPGVARGLLAEPGGAGAAVAAKRMEVLERLSRAIDRARRETVASRHSPPPVTSRFILSAIHAAVLKFLADTDAGAGDLEAELPSLLYIAVDFYLGPEAARAQVRALRSDN